MNETTYVMENHPFKKHGIGNRESVILEFDVDRIQPQPNSRFQIHTRHNQRAC